MDVRNDYSAAVIIGALNKRRDGFAPGYYLVDAWRGKVEFAQLKRQVIRLHQSWNPRWILVEDAASGISLTQELRADTLLPIKPIKPDRDKYQRLAAITPALESRRLLLPEKAWWRDDFIRELTSFPAGTHDWCDALTMALNFLRDDREPSALRVLKLQAAMKWVKEGLNLEAAASRADLAPAELQHWLKLEQHPLSPHPATSPATPADDEPGAQIARQAANLIQAFRRGQHITDLDPDRYKSYLRPVLLTCSDPDAAKLISALDRRFGLA